MMCLSIICCFLQIQIVLLVILIIAMIDAFIGSFIPRSCNNEDTLQGFTFYDGKNVLFTKNMIFTCT